MCYYIAISFFIEIYINFNAGESINNKIKIKLKQNNNKTRKKDFVMYSEIIFFF